MQQAPIDMEQIKRDFRGEVRIFPQPHLVLLPDGFAPLKVRDEPDVELLRDAADDDKLVGLALYEPGWEADFGSTSQPVFNTVCIGRLLQYRPKPDGTCEALLYGLFRARIHREIAEYPYRRAEVEILDEVSGADESETIARRMRRALDLVPQRRSMVWEMRRMATQLRGVDATAGRCADAVADVCEFPPEQRYKLLQEPNVLRRLDLLITLLEKRAYAGSPRVPRGSRPELN